MKPHWPPGPYWEEGAAAGVAAAIATGAAEEAAAGVLEMGAAVAYAYNGCCAAFGIATMTTWPALMKALSPLLSASRCSCLTLELAF